MIIPVSLSLRIHIESNFLIFSSLNGLIQHGSFAYQFVPFPLSNLTVYRLAFFRQKPDLRYLEMWLVPYIALLIGQNFPETKRFLLYLQHS